MDFPSVASIAPSVAEGAFKHSSEVTDEDDKGPVSRLFILFKVPSNGSKIQNLSFLWTS